MSDSMYRLKEMLCDELDQYAKKGELTAGSLDIVDKLSHALKSITTIMAMEDADGEYSGTYRMYPRYMRDRDGMGGQTERGSSYARKRDSRGRYSRDYSGAMDEMVDQLKDMMDSAPDQSTRQDIQRLIKKFENS